MCLRGAVSEHALPREALGRAANMYINEVRENVKALSSTSTQNPGSPHLDICDNEVHWVDYPLHSPFLAPSRRKDNCKPGILVYLYGEDEYFLKSKCLKSMIA